MIPAFSVLIPAIFERIDRLKALAENLESQIGSAWPPQVEIVSVIDNRIVSIGEKRQRVLDASTGRYVAFVDDDDFVSPDYIQSILEAIRAHPGVDVITFNNSSVIENHKPITINMRLGQENEQVRFDDESEIPPVIRRAAWHTCAWKGSLARMFTFQPVNYGEDWLWAKNLNLTAKTEHHIDRCLHRYVYSKDVSRAT